MPKASAEKAINPRYEAMKSIVQNRLNDVGNETGESLKDIMEAQGVEMIDPDTPIAPDVKDSDSHVDQNKKIAVDIDSKSFIPDVEDIKTEIAPPAEDISLEPDAEKGEKLKIEPEPVPEPVPEPAAEVAGTPVYEKDGEYFTKIRVNGVEEEIAFNTLKASAQKDRASFEKFQAAAAKEQELAAREEKLNAAQARQAVQDTPTQPILAEKDIDDTVNKLYDSLAYEDEDTVKATLAEIVSGSAQPQSAEGREEVSTQSGPVDIQAEVNAAIERNAMQEWEAGRQAAVSQWEIDFEDISSDPALRTFANEQSARIAAENPNQPLQDTLTQAGEKAREWRDFQAGKAPTLEPTAAIDTDARKALKRTAAAPVRANGTAAARKVEDNTPPSRSDIVAQIREGRGQVY